MNIFADKIELGKEVVIDPTATIRGINGNAKKITLGDHVYIGANVQIICDEFSLGDYSKVHHHTNVHGYKPCTIGHNAWIGQYSIIDSVGGTYIGNNCGIGAHSQLWSHIKYGDRLEGCNFLSEKQMNIGNDVWFVGHCIVSPINAGDKSMALVGSVITKDMAFNEVYAGNPAQSLSQKIGFQFRDVEVDDKLIQMNKYLKESGVNQDIIKIVKREEEFLDDGRSYFAVETRTYLKQLHPEEVKFMKFLLPEKGKFVPKTS